MSLACLHDAEVGRRSACLSMHCELVGFESCGLCRDVGIHVLQEYVGGTGQLGTIEGVSVSMKPDVSVLAVSLLGGMQRPNMSEKVSHSRSRLTHLHGVGADPIIRSSVSTLSTCATRLTVFGIRSRRQEDDYPGNIVIMIACPSKRRFTFSLLEQVNSRGLIPVRLVLGPLQSAFSPSPIRLLYVILPVSFAPARSDPDCVNLELPFLNSTWCSAGHGNLGDLLREVGKTLILDERVWRTRWSRW